MLCQLRVYTINRDQMDEWLKCFNQEAVPLMASHGLKADTVWVTEDKTQFIWTRSFRDAEDMKRKEESLYGDPRWNEAIGRIRSFIAKMEVTLMEPIAL